MSQSEVNKRKKDKTGETQGKSANLTLRWALRESLPPTEVTLQMYVPMSPDHVWEMCRVPSGSSRRRGDVLTSITEPLFSQTYLEVCTCVCKSNTPGHTHSHFNTLSLRVVTVNPFALCQFIQQNTEGADTDEKPREADGKVI